MIDRTNVRARVAVACGTAALAAASACGSPAAKEPPPTDGSAGVDATTWTTPSPVVGVPVDARTSLNDLAYDARGRLLALAEDGVRIVGTRRFIRTATSDLGGGEALSFKPGGRDLLVHAYGEHGRELIRARRLTQSRTRWTATIPNSRYGYPQVHWGADGGSFLVETELGDAIYALRTGRRLGLLHTGYDAYLGDQPLSPDGTQVVYPLRNGLGIWTVATGARRTIDFGHVAEAPSWSPDGHTLAVAGRDLVLVSAGSGADRTVKSPSTLQSVTWSPDGRFIAAYGDDPDVHNGDHPGYRITVFEVATGAWWVVGRLRDGPEFEPLAWSADSRRVAYQRSDGSP